MCLQWSYYSLALSHCYNHNSACVPDLVARFIFWRYQYCVNLGKYLAGWAISHRGRRHTSLTVRMINSIRFSVNIYICIYVYCDTNISIEQDKSETARYARKPPVKNSHLVPNLTTYDDDFAHTVDGRTDGQKDGQYQNMIRPIWRPTCEKRFRDFIDSRLTCI